MLSYLRNYLIENDFDGFLIINLSNIKYLSNFSGSSAQILISKEKNYFITDFRYKIYANEKIDKTKYEIIIYDDYFKTFQELVKPIKKLAIEGKYISISTLNSFKEKFKDVEFIPTNNVIENLRAIKSYEEIQKIKKACDIARNVFEEILNIIEPEKMTERDLAIEMEYIARKKYNVEKMAFETIVLTSYRSAMPHGRPSNYRILNNNPLLIDFGIVYDGYCCDITRMIWIGSNINEKFLEVYKIVSEALYLVQEKTKIGLKNKEVDSITRDYLKSFGYDENYFGHALGHSIGIDVHEMPALSYKADEWILKGNEVFTIEPGVYIENEFGIRIEDTVYLDKEENKIINLTNITKDIIKI
jgi:Xaa-Pro aminopeptidase